jgi:hypothetical protein
MTDLNPKAELAPFLVVIADANWHTPPANPAIPLKLTPGKHTLSVSYPVDDKTWVTTPAVELAVTVDDWGGRSNSARARLRLAKSKLQPGEPLTFDLDLRNEAAEARTTDANPFACDLVLDGTRYHYVEAIDRKANPKDLKPGSELVPLLTVSPDDGWGALAAPGDRFKLTPGKHTLAVSFDLNEKTRVVTRPVEFEVADDWGDPADGIRARVRLAKNKFKTGEALAFELALKNTGTENRKTVVKGKGALIRGDTVEH